MYTEKIQEVAIAEVGFIRRTADRRRDFNQNIEELSKRQKSLRQQIMLCKDTERTDELKRERNRIMHAIRNLIDNEREENLNTSTEQN